MNNEDMSDIIQKLNNMLHISNNSQNNSSHKQTDVSSNSNNINEDTLKNLINNFSINNDSKSNDNSDKETIQNYNSNFNFDVNTILKMKNVMDKMNSNKNDPRSNLLLSLKPYLNNNRQQKLDQCIKFLNISQIIEELSSENGVDSK